MVEHHEKAATNADGLPEGAAGADCLPQQAGEGGGVLVSILGSRGIKIIFPEGDTTTTAQLQTTTRCEVNNRFFERNSPMLCCEIRFFARPTKKIKFWRHYTFSFASFFDSIISPASASIPGKGHSFQFSKVACYLISQDDDDDSVSSLKQRQR